MIAMFKMTSCTGIILYTKSQNTGTRTAAFEVVHLGPEIVGGVTSLDVGATEIYYLKKTVNIQEM